MGEPSKLPWETRADGWQPWPGSIAIISDDGEIVAYTTSGANEKVNAEFLVKAASCHDDLVKALRAAQFGAKNGKCPVCAGWDISSNGETPFVHTKDCIIGEALAKAATS